MTISFSYRNVAVTGGAGFVGSALALALKRDFPSAQVKVLDNLKRRGSELNLPRLKSGGVHFVHGDIRNPQDLAALGDADLLLECSAEPSVLAGYGESPMYVIETNLMGTAHCLEYARLRRADVIFLSTSRVYPLAALNRIVLNETESRFEVAPEQAQPGVSAEGINEAFSLDGGRTLYGATKLSSELLLKEFIEMYGLRGVANRCGVIAGPWQMGKVDQGIVAHWVAGHVFGRELSYIGYGGEGRQVRDILHVDDLYRLIVLQLGALEEHSGEIYNVGGGRECSVSLRELTALCQQATGRRLDIHSQAETRAGDIPVYLSDCRKVIARTGWERRYGVEQIVDEVAAWMTSQRHNLQAIFV